MKNILLFVLVALAAFQVSMAQEVEIGIKGGLNVANLGSNDFSYKTRLAYHIGGTAEFITTPFFSVQTELHYSKQGAEIDRSQGAFLNYHYLNIPVLAKAYFFEDASFLLGIQYGFLMSAIDKNDINKQIRTSSVNRHDFSAAFGLAYKLDDRWNFEIRYNLGITNTANRDIIYEQRITNKVLQISFGYIF